LPSIEETALAVNALAVVPRARDAALRGVDWLIAATVQGRETPAAPIGLYFARLWYSEKLYPLIHLAAALERVNVAVCGA
jgi:squalene-hopene/tetraprenyl-beta-curcumene cyclase